MMNRLIIAMLAICAASNVNHTSGAHPGPQAEHADTLTLLTTSRAAARGFLTTLKSLLVSQLAKGGPVHAVVVCTDTAQELARQAEERHGLRIRRVSSRWRNRLAVPDAYEKKQLDVLEKLSRNGSLSERTELYEIVKGDSMNYFRYMKPIVVQSMCLACHGRRERMSDELLKLLSERYPEDTSYDYASGDLRGALSITIGIR